LNKLIEEGRAEIVRVGVTGKDGRTQAMQRYRLVKK
jgi:hypothetical protein